MASKRVTANIRAPFKGLLSGNNPGGDPGFFSKCTNVMFDKSGCAIKRPGFVSHDAAPASLGTVSIDGMFTYVKQGTGGSPSTKTIFHAGGKIYAVPNAYYFENSAHIKSDMTAGKLVDHAVLSDKLYMANGTEVLQEYGSAKVGNITQAGTGLNDISTSGLPTSGTEISVVIAIDGEDTPDTFKYSLNGGSTWESETVSITGSEQSIGHGVSITFTATAGHTLTDEFSFTIYPVTSCTDILTPPASGLTGSFSPSLLEVHRSSLWAAGVPGNPSRLFKSVPLVGGDFDTNLTAFDTDDGYALEGASQIDVRPDDGTGIVGLVGDHFGQLIVFKGSSIHRLLGATKADFMLPPDGIIDGIETITGSIVRANNDVFFASRKGIHKLSTVQQYGDNQETFLSLPIQEFYDSIDKFSITNRCQSIHWAEVSCIFWAFSSTGSAENDVILVYNYAVDAWSVWSGVSVKSFGVFKFDGSNALFVGDYSSRVGRADFENINDFGEAVIFEAETNISLGDSALSKGWRSLFANYNRSGSLSIKHKIDNNAWSSSSTISSSGGVVLGVFVLGTDILADDKEIETKAIEINQNGRVLTVNIQNSTLNESASIVGFTIQAMIQGFFLTN